MKKLQAWMARQCKFWSSQSVEWWVKRATVGWGLVIFFIICSRYKELMNLGLNELGDFFAGMFGPVAFGWLVLGYTQQGRELKLSSKALRMQTKELNDSVKQQTAMVEAQKISLENHERSLEPLLVLTHVETHLVNNHGYETFRLDNTAAYCESVRMESACNGLRLMSQPLPTMMTGDTEVFSVQPIAGKSQIEITIYYTKISGLENSQSFIVKKFIQEDGDRIFIEKLPFTRREAVAAAS
ncbi:hypothetical protein [Pseudomonas sp. RA_35y_Pfl2_P32]|uniref:hypothetical protein n=1 Tax=Pseudomonas sp. RA_35y_Pfl2_P32 TaxID=3088705 RepID=UPI0030DBAC0F